MATRIPASMRTREALSALIEGRLASPAGRSELVELATRLIVEEALEGAVRDALDRGYHERGEAPGQGHRNGHRKHRLKSAEGGLEYAAPQVAGLAQPFRSALRDHLKGHTEALESLAVEMLARGLPVRDIEDAFKDETGRLLLSKTAVAEIGKQLWEDDQAFKSRDLAEYDIAYLFIDGIAERIRPGQWREPVLAVWGFSVAVLFHRIGPYHFARLAAAGARCELTAVELSAVDDTYAWSPVNGAPNFKRVTLPRRWRCSTSTEPWAGSVRSCRPGRRPGARHSRRAASRTWRRSACSRPGAICSASCRWCSWTPPASTSRAPAATPWAGATIPRTIVPTSRR
jgi:hypothetical protein